MKPKFLLFVVTCVAIAIFAAPANASLSLSSANRYVLVSPGALLNTSSAGGTYNQSISDPLGDATALQDTTIGASSITGVGVASMDDYTAAGGLADTQFLATFTLATPHAYSLEGLLDVDFEVGAGLAALTFTGTGGLNISQASDFGPLTGTIGPGTFTLTVRALAAVDSQAGNRGVGASSFDFSLRLTDLAETGVPEPASAALCAMGVACVLRRRAMRMR